MILGSLRVRAIAAALALFAFGTLGTACDPSERLPARSAKPRPCPPPPEPAHQAVVVGTIGKMHMVESRYPLSRLGDVLTSFKPELVLVGVRVDAFREEHLEDASFEMTYVSHLAKQHGAYVEPIDWFRDEDLGAVAPPVEPWDAAEIAKRETDVLVQPALYTFELANSGELLQRVMLARAAEQRHRGGAPLASRRAGFLQHLTASAVARHDRPKRVLAFVDVLDRPTVDAALEASGYATKSALDVVAKAKEVMLGDIPPEVLATYKHQLDRVRERAEKATGAQRAFWTERQQVLGVVVDRRAACCVTQAALGSR